MRFMYIVTSSQPMRGPTPALMEAMHKLSEREIKAGRMLDSGGLNDGGEVDQEHSPGAPSKNARTSQVPSQPGM